MFHNASPVLRASFLLTFWQNRLSQHPKKQKSPDGAPKILEGTIWWKKCPTSRYGTFNPSFYPIGLMYAIFPYNNSTLPYKPAKCGQIYMSHGSYEYRALQIPAKCFPWFPWYLATWVPLKVGRTARFSCTAAASSSRKTAQALKRNKKHATKGMHL